MSEDTIHDERWRRFMALQRRALACLSPEGRERLNRRNLRKRAIPAPPGDGTFPSAARTAAVAGAALPYVPDSVRVVSEQMASDPRHWQAYFFNFVDDFRRYARPEQVADPPCGEVDPRLAALLAGAVLYLARERGAEVPAWARRLPPLADPWFVSGMPAMRAWELVECPLSFKCKNVFVTDNFMSRA